MRTAAAPKGKVTMSVCSIPITYGPGPNRIYAYGFFISIVCGCCATGNLCFTLRLKKNPSARALRRGRNVWCWEKT